MKILRTSFWYAVSCAHAPGYCLIVSHFSIWATEEFQKNWSLPAVLFWQISATICVCLSIAFFFSSFDHGTFEEISTVAYALMGVILELKLNQKTRFTIMLTLMLLIELCEVNEVFKCRERRMMRWRMDKSSSLEMPMSPHEISKRYTRQSLGMPRGTPSSSTKIRSPFKTLYFYCFVCYAFFLEHLYFRFHFSFVLYAAINGWTPTYLFWRRRTPFFIAKNTLVLTLFVQRVFCFSNTAFSFHFPPWFLFRSCYLFVSRCV
jgi:hypothetical protein